MNISYRDIFIAIAMAILIMLTSYVVLPILLQMFIGFEMYKRFSSIEIYISSRAIPFPVFASPSIYVFIGTAISIASEILYFMYRGRLALFNTLRRQVPELISLTSSYATTGASILTSLEESAKLVGKPIYDYVYRYVELVRIGEDPIKSFDECFNVFPRDLRVALSSIPIAIISGGRVPEILLHADRYIRQMTRLEELRRNRIEGYKAVLLLAIVAFIIGAIVTLVMLTSMARIPSSIALIMGAIDIAEVATYYYISSLVLITISSIAVSRIVYGDIVHAYRYISILSLVTGIVFSVSSLYIF